ncbi:MAG: hypothetical protein ACEQR8_11170 [Cypionkella sp.]
MGAWLPLLVALPFVALLLWSGSFASRRFGRFAELPAHFDWAGRATRMAPRRTMAWILPVVFAITLLGIAVLVSALPREMQNGDPVAAVLVGGIASFAAQCLVLWLTERWARTQG